jgi:hypothetical protein
MSSTIPNDIVSDQIKSLLRLPDVGQIGYVVEDVYRAVKEWQIVHQRVPWLVLDHDHTCTFRGRQGRCTLRIALAYEGPLQIELIQVLDGETIHVGAASKPEGQIHHFGFMVRNLDHRLEHCQNNGAQVLQKGTIKSAGLMVDYAYLDTSAIGGPDLILELIQWRLGPCPMPVNRLVFNISCALGSWNVFRGRIVR